MMFKWNIITSNGYIILSYLDFPQITQTCRLWDIYWKFKQWSVDLKDVCNDCDWSNPELKQLTFLAFQEYREPGIMMQSCIMLSKTPVLFLRWWSVIKSNSGTLVNSKGCLICDTHHIKCRYIQYHPSISLLTWRVHFRWQRTCACYK